MVKGQQQKSPNLSLWFFHYQGGSCGEYSGQGQPGSKTAIFIPSFIYFYIYIVVEVLFYIILVAKTGVMTQLINFNRSRSCFSHVREILTYKIQYNERQEIKTWKIIVSIGLKKLICISKP